MRFLLCDLLQIIRKEGTDLLKGDLVHLIVKVGVVSAGYDEQLLVAAGQLLVGVLAEVPRMRPLAVDEEHRAANLSGIGKYRHGDEGKRRRFVPAGV